MSERMLTGLARIPLVLLRQAETIGLDRAKLMEAGKLTEEELASPDARIPLIKVWDVWSAAADWSGDPSVGVRMGMAVTARDLGLVGYTMIHSANLGDALERLNRYGRIISDVLQFEIERDGDRVRLVFGSAPRLVVMRHPIDARLASLLAVAREITANDIVPIRVEFPYPRPTPSEIHESFFRAPLEFDAASAAIELRCCELDLRITSNDSTLREYLDQLALGTLKGLDEETSLIDRVRRMIWNYMSAGNVALGRVSAALGMSQRSLQRQLGQRGVTFAGLLDELRHELALSLLRERNLAIYEVAYLLGYSEPSTFYRAFRRWENLSPDRYRRSIDR